jgi:ankyrin repeat protein
LIDFFAKTLPRAENVRRAKLGVGADRWRQLGVPDSGSKTKWLGALTMHIKLLPVLVAGLLLLGGCSGWYTAFDLHNAAASNDVATAERILQAQPKLVSAVNNEHSQSQPLHTAAEFGATGVVRVLLKHGADPNAIDNLHQTPLHVAAKKGHHAAVVALLQGGAKVDFGKVTALRIACWEGHKKVVEVLLQAGANVNQKTVGSTALHAASEQNHPTVIAVLVAKGADLEAKDADGLTPLDVAANYKAVVAMTELLKSGAKHSWISASFCGDVNALKKAIEVHGSLKQLQSPAGWTPLHYAANNCKTGMVRYLISSGCNVDGQNSTKDTPLHVACETGCVEVVKELLQAGAKLGFENEWGERPLHLACTSGNEEIVGLLLKHGAKMEVKTKKDRMPLQLAVQNKRKNIVKLLGTHGAKVNATDREGRTALHHAIRYYCDLEMIHMLLAMGADPLARDNQDATPIDYANGRPEIIEVLEKGKNKKSQH